MKSESCHQCQYLAKIFAAIEQGLEDRQGQEREDFRHFVDHAKEAFVKHLVQYHSTPKGIFWPTCHFCHEHFQDDYELKDHLTNHPDLLQHIFHAAMSL